MNTINNLGSMKRAMSVYDDGLPVEIRVNGIPVRLTIDYQMRQEDSPGQPSKFVIELSAPDGIQPR